MIVEEFKIDSTLIRIDNSDIVTKEKHKEVIDTLLELIIKNKMNRCI